MAANATSAALMLSDIPWNGPIGVIRVGRIDGKFVFNPAMDEVNCHLGSSVYPFVLHLTDCSWCLVVFTTAFAFSQWGQTSPYNGLIFLMST